MASTKAAMNTIKMKYPIGFSLVKRSKFSLLRSTSGGVFLRGRGMSVTLLTVKVMRLA